MSEHVLLLNSPPDDVNDVHDLFEGVWASDTTVPAEDRMAFETAVVELAANVIQHADAGDGVTWRLSVSCTPTTLEARLTDDGREAEIELQGRSIPDALAESGRGLTFVQMLVDELSYRHSDAGNEWSISKRRSDGDT